MMSHVFRKPKRHQPPPPLPESILAMLRALVLGAPRDDAILDRPEAWAHLDAHKAGWACQLADEIPELACNLVETALGEPLGVERSLRRLADALDGALARDPSWPAPSALELLLVRRLHFNRILAELCESRIQRAEKSVANTAEVDGRAYMTEREAAKQLNRYRERKTRATEAAGRAERCLKAFHIHHAQGRTAIAKVMEAQD
jgi:hypothetical protein